VQHEESTTTRNTFRAGYAISRAERTRHVVVRRELAIIRDDLHANAVRIVAVMSNG